MKEMVTLGEVVKVDRQAASSAECQQLPYIGLEHIESNGHLIAGFKPVPENLAATKFRFSPRHVLYGKLRPYLNKVITVDFDGVCTTEILPLLPQGSKLNRGYLRALLKSPGFVSWASSNVSGANLPRLSPERLTEYRFHLPPLDEQHRIVAQLDKADRLRRTRRYAQTLSDTFLQSVFLEMFGDPVTNPKGWDIKLLGELLAIEPHIGTIKPASSSGKQICVRVGELGESHVALRECGRVTLDGDELRRFTASPGDLLLARAIGSQDHLGKMSILQETSEKVVFDSHVMRLRVDNRRIRNVFLQTLFSTSGGRILFLSKARRTAVQFNINAEQIQDIPIPMPDLQHQEQFMRVVRTHKRLQIQQQEAARQADHLFHSLLHRAFQTEK